MPWPVIIALIIGAAGLLGITGRSQMHSRHSRGSASIQHIKGLSETEVDSLLGRLKVTEPPEPILGAMCYDMAMPLLVEEYICRVCGEKTFYESGSWLLTELPECRMLVEGIDAAVDFEVELVETRFCSHCEPETETPAMLLRVTRADGPAGSSTVTRTDLIMLNSFLYGSLTYSGDQGEEMPLLPYADRIAELLGIEVSCQ